MTTTFAISLFCIDLIVLTVGGAYLQMTAAKARLAAEQAQVDTVNAVYHQSVQQLAQGIIAKVDADKNLVQLLTEQQRLLSLQNDYAKQKINLACMMPRGLHTDEDTISLLRCLAVHYPDDVIAGIFNRQERRTTSGERFTALHVGSLRRYRNIPRFEPPAEPPTGQIVPIRQAARVLGVNTSTFHRWLNDGFIAGEQLTPGAPWQIRITDELRARFVEQAASG